MSKTTRQIHGLEVTFEGLTHTINLPAGLRVSLIAEGSNAGNYFLDEFPDDIFPPNSILRHDAEHRGIELTRAQVDKGETAVKIIFPTEDDAERFLYVAQQLAELASSHNSRLLSLAVSLRSFIQKSILVPLP